MKGITVTGKPLDGRPVLPADCNFSSVCRYGPGAYFVASLVIPLKHLQNPLGTYVAFSRHTPESQDGTVSLHHEPDLTVAGKKYIFLRFHIKPQPGGFRHPAEQVISCLFIPNQAFHIVEYGAAKFHVPLVSPQYMLLHLHPIIPSGRKLQCPPQNISGLQRTAESAESRTPAPWT